MASFIFVETCDAITDVYLYLPTEGARKIVLALPRFALEVDSPAYQELGGRIFSTLKYDLERSGIFDLVDISQFYSSAGADRGAINFNQWFLVGMQALTVGQIDIEGDKLELKGWLYDVPMGQLIIGKVYKGSISDLDQVVHRWADEIVFRFTGQPGIAQSKIAMVINTGNGKEIGIIDYDGRNLRMITANKSLNLNPDFSPDNETIIFTSYQRGNPDLFLLDLTSGKNTRLTEEALNITPSYSSDGTKVAFGHSVEGNPEVFVLELQTRKKRRITVSPGVDTSPSFSPNNREICFTSDRGGAPQVYVMNADGGDLRRLTYSGDYNDAPDWSPKGDLIAFQSKIGGEFQICTIAVDGSQFQQWTSGPGSNESPSWAPDGRHIVFSSTRHGGSHLFCLDIVSGSVVKITDGNGRYTTPVWSN